MNYKEALQYLEGLQKRGISMSTKRMELLLERLDNPHKKGRFIHIAGTNGKGSVCQFIAQILREAGYKTGVFTSPELNKINETINIEGDISDDEFGSVVKRVADEAGNIQITRFEALTAAAFLHFAQNQCDFVVLECGLGGSEDATNVIDTPLVSVITKISLDHMEYLGDSICKIAQKKAGIIKGGMVVVAPQQYSQAYSQIQKSAGKLIKVEQADIKNYKKGSFDFGQLKNISVGLRGAHQAQNAATAIEVANALIELGYNLKTEHIYKGLKNTVWQCRLEKIGHQSLIYIDGAHNPDGMTALREFFECEHTDKKITLVCGILKDKDYVQMLSIIAPICQRAYTAAPSSSRALSAQALRLEFEKLGIKTQAFDSIAQAVAACRSNMQNDEIICAVGSLYFVAEAKKYFLEEN